MTKEEWLLASDKAKPVPARLLGIARAIHRCGWYFYSEVDLAHAMGILGPLGVEVGGQEGLPVLHALKQHLEQNMKKLQKGNEGLV